MKSPTFAERLIILMMVFFSLSGLVYWYAHLWHHWSAANIRYWSHCLVLAGVLILIVPAKANSGNPLAPVMALAFAASLVAQTLVWLGLLTAPIF